MGNRVDHLAGERVVGQATAALNGWEGDVARHDGRQAGRAGDLGRRAHAFDLVEHGLVPIGAMLGLPGGRRRVHHRLGRLQVAVRHAESSLDLVPPGGAGAHTSTSGVDRPQVGRHACPRLAGQSGRRLAARRRAGFLSQLHGLVGFVKRGASPGLEVDAPDVDPLPGRDALDHFVPLEGHIACQFPQPGEGSVRRGLVREQQQELVPAHSHGLALARRHLLDGLRQGLEQLVAVGVSSSAAVVEILEVVQVNDGLDRQVIRRLEDRHLPPGPVAQSRDRIARQVKNLLDLSLGQRLAPLPLVTNSSQLQGSAPLNRPLDRLGRLAWHFDPLEPRPAEDIPWQRAARGVLQESSLDAAPDLGRRPRLGHARGVGPAHAADVAVLVVEDLEAGALEKRLDGDGRRPFALQDGRPDLRRPIRHHLVLTSAVGEEILPQLSKVVAPDRPTRAG